MGIIETFEAFAAAFERAVDDDDWTRLAPYLAEDATYINIGGPDPKSVGRDAVIAYLKADVANSDRRFDSRNHVPLTAPNTQGNHLSRQWRCTYTLAGVPDLVVEGEARYVFAGGLIKAIEQEITPASAQQLTTWMTKYGDQLSGGG